MVVGSWSNFQHNLTHDNWSKAVANEVVSADKVLVTTRWIFLLPQDIGLIGPSWFLTILAWVRTMILPAYECDLLLDANDASENTMKRSWSSGIGLMVTVRSWCLLASWSNRFASSNVSTVAELMADWSPERRFAKSGRVFVEAHLEGILLNHATGLALHSWLLGQAECGDLGQYWLGIFSEHRLTGLL